jgi:hypothetical protein
MERRPLILKTSLTSGFSLGPGLASLTLYCLPVLTAADEETLRPGQNRKSVKAGAAEELWRPRSNETLS